MDGTSEDVQPPCSLAIKSPPVLASHYPYPVIYFSRGVMTSKWHNLDDHPGWLGTSNGLLVLLSGILAKVNKPNKYILISHKHKLVP